MLNSITKSKPKMVHKRYNWLLQAKRLQFAYIFNVDNYIPTSLAYFIIERNTFAAHVRIKLLVPWPTPIKI